MNHSHPLPANSSTIHSRPAPDGQIAYCSHRDSDNCSVVHGPIKPSSEVFIYSQPTSNGYPGLCDRHIGCVSRESCNIPDPYDNRHRLALFNKISAGRKDRTSRGTNSSQNTEKAETAFTKEAGKFMRHLSSSYKQKLPQRWPKRRQSSRIQPLISDGHMQFYSKKPRLLFSSSF